MSKSGARFPALMLAHTKGTTEAEQARLWFFSCAHRCRYLILGYRKGAWPARVADHPARFSDNYAESGMIIICLVRLPRSKFHRTKRHDAP
jgi:hypothetical protein